MKKLIFTCAVAIGAIVAVNCFAGADEAEAGPCGCKDAINCTTASGQPGVECTDFPGNQCSTPRPCKATGTGIFE
jgi:hypothetical protein